MTVSNKIKSLLAARSKANKDLAEYLGISQQALSNKFYRGSFNSVDLIKIATFCGCQLSFICDDLKIDLDIDDIE